MKRFILVFLLLAIFGASFGQTAVSGGHCKLKGRIIDSTNRKPIDYAAVTAFLNGSSNVAGGIISDENGYFVIDNLLPGEYRVKVDFIGFNSKELQHINLSEKVSTVNLGDVLIASNTHTLNDVTIKGTRNFMENHLDKLVYNVEKDISSQGGVATDVLKKVPMVAVDMDGNIDLQGDKNVRVFINGKPSAMFDNNLADALKAIPANQIKSIEVITSPGAQYDAQGTGGIINIILKDNKAKGINGNCNLSGGSRYQNGSVNVHAKNGDLDLNASLSGNMQLPVRSYSSLNRINDSNGVTRSQLLQDGHSSTERNGYRAAIGFDWSINKTNDLNGSVSYNNFGNRSDGAVPQMQINDALLVPDTLATTRSSNNYYRYRGEDWNLNYRKKYATEGEELSISYQGSIGGSDYNYQQSQQLVGLSTLASGGKGNNGFKDLENNITADYSRPFGKDIMLNAGIKGAFSRMTSNSNHGILVDSTQQYYYDPSQYNVFNFNRDIYSVYASLNFPLSKKYSMKVGIRDEYTNSSSPGDTIVIPSYNFITPTALISRALKDNQTIKLSYARRIQRPGYSQYNPFVDATDPSSLSKGNPAIVPQKMHALELSYFKFYEQGSNISLSLFYRYSQFDWQGYSTFSTAYTAGNVTYSNVTVNTTINAGTEQSSGLNLSGTWAVNDKLQLRPYASFFEKYIESPLLASGSTSSFNYRANLNISYQFNKNLAAEFFNSYNSAKYEVQGKFPSFYNYSFSVRQQLFSKKATLSFSTTNPFNKFTSQTTYLDASNFHSVSERRYPYQYFTFSFSFKFGKIEYFEKKEEPAESTPPENS